MLAVQSAIALHVIFIDTYAVVLLWDPGVICIGNASQDVPETVFKSKLIFFVTNGKALKIWFMQLCDGVTAAESQHD